LFAYAAWFGPPRLPKRPLPSPRRRRGPRGRAVPAAWQGYIGLQDHDSPCWFKNIKIRPLK
jgi:hypothetical protein